MVYILARPGMKFEDLVNLTLKDRPKGRPEHGQEYVIGFEYQLLDNALNPDGRVGPSHQAGALYDMFPPARTRRGRWASGTIRGWWPGASTSSTGSTA